LYYCSSRSWCCCCGVLISGCDVVCHFVVVSAVVVEVVVVTGVVIAVAVVVAIENVLLMQCIFGSVIQMKISTGSEFTTLLSNE